MESSDTDAEFTNGMMLFANAYAGRLDELVAKLEALAEKWNQPTTIERVKGYFTGLRDLTIKTTVETLVNAAMKGGQ